MVEIIKVEQITRIAMTEGAGMDIRKKISEALECQKEVVLDFKNVTLFATPFFNASIGYFIIKLTPEKAMEVIKMENLTPLGEETYYHSVENAKKIYEKKESIEVIGKITAETIEGK